MADPRDELVDPILGNEPGMLPPEPLRLTVRPRGVEAPPITDVGWGEPTGTDGRPSSRLFEPDQSEARQPTYGERLGLPYVDQQGGSGALGGLVKGVRDWFNAPAASTASTASTASAAPAAPRDATAGPRQMWQGGYGSPTPTMENQPAPVRGLNWGVNELNDYVGGTVEAGRVINDPGATPQQVDEARQQEARKTAGLTANLAGFGVTGASVRGGASAGVFGGRIEPARVAFAERLEKEGARPQEIWKQTGIARFADRQWRQEIPDLAASYRGGVDDIASRIFDQQNPTRQGKYRPDQLDYGSILAKQEAQQKLAGGKLVLEDVIPHHPELYGKYPELRRMPVTHDAHMQASGGYLARNKNAPEGRIYYREEPDPKTGKVTPRGLTFKTLIHEIDHAIANIEGFAKGANSDITNVNIVGSPARRYFETIVKKFPPGTMTPAQINEARERAASTAYWASAGENSAKIAEIRADMTPEQLKATYPGDMMQPKMPVQNVEYNVPYSQKSMGVTLNPTPIEMQAASRPAPSTQPKFPQYGERYPEVGPPVQAVDAKTGKEYMAKQLTPEAEAFAKELGRVDKAMTKEGYTPYFDPAKREHVDPKHYPANVDTRTIIPKKLTPKDEAMIPIVTGEESRARLRAAYQRGTEMPNTKDWYAMKQLEDEFIKELGPEAGRKAFQDKIATSMGATTGGADPTTNWRMAQYGNYLRQHNLPYPTSAHEMPYPIGGRFAGQNIALHKKIFDEGGFPALGKEYPKRHNFSQNFTGNRGAATMDEQMSNLMTPGTLMPPKGRYGYYENTLGEEAAKVGVQPQNYQDVAWSGAKNLKDPRYKAGEPFIQTINESIERTHRLTGMPRDEIVKRGLIRSEIPMYGVAGAVGLGSLVDPTGYNR